MHDQRRAWKQVFFCLPFSDRCVFNFGEVRFPDTPSINAYEFVWRFSILVTPFARNKEKHCRHQLTGARRSCTAALVGYVRHLVFRCGQGHGLPKAAVSPSPARKPQWQACSLGILHTVPDRDDTHDCGDCSSFEAVNLCPLCAE